MHKILVPIDGSDHSLKALHIACDLAGKYRACIVLLHVLAEHKTASQILDMPLSRKFSPTLFAALQNDLQTDAKPLHKKRLRAIGSNLLKIATAKASRLGLETQLLPLASGDPAQNIIAAQKLTGASTIVMGSRGLPVSLIDHEQSVSQTVFANADCTCISVK